MIPVMVAVAEVICVVILIVYALLDSDRLIPSTIAAILSIVLGWILGYQFLFGMIQTGVTTTYSDPAYGWFFIMVGIMILVLTLAVVADQFIRKKESAAV